MTITEAHKGQQQITARQRGGVEFAVLLSCASAMSCGSELVQPERYGSRVEANLAYAGVRRHGLNFAVMRRPVSGDVDAQESEPWSEVGTGCAAVEVIRRRWESPRCAT